MAKGPLGNSPRDLLDDFVGVPAPLYGGGEPPKKTRNPQKITSNTFHSSVTGATSNKRADRPGHFRSGGFVRGYASGGRLTAGERQSLPSSDFALPGKGKGPKGAGSGSYPIPDESHARNALARVSQHGSSSEKAAVRAKVKAKYPGIGQK